MENIIVGKLDITERLAFLAENFDVFETDDLDSVKDKCDTYIDGEWDTSNPSINNNGDIIAIVSTRFNKRGFPIVKVSIAYDVFTAMVGADPTENKICLQWMLDTFSRLLKNEEWVEASRFSEEDLPQANEYLILFEANKRKKRFKEMAKHTLKGFKNITNINEYRDLSQLFNVVDPFIIRDSSGVESMMDRYVKMGQGEIPFRDRKYTVFIPLTVEANMIFDDFAAWCTAKKGGNGGTNSMFKRYTNGSKKPNGKNSTIYIVIDNGFFTGDNENLYQIHFETKQIKDRSNNIRNIDLYPEVLIKSEGLLNYFGDELMTMAKDFKRGVDSNHYIDILIDFGFTEALFDFFDVETPIISIDAETSKKKRRVPKLPDISRFKYITHLVIMDSALQELHPSLGSLTTLRNLVLAGNNINNIPREIGRLKNLIYLNLWNNPITSIPEEIKYLDKTMGGKLERISICKKDISENNYQKLKELLPTVEF